VKKIEKIEERIPGIAINDKLISEMDREELIDYLCYLIEVADLMKYELEKKKKEVL